MNSAASLAAARGEPPASTGRCHFRDLCTAHTAISCRDTQQSRMREAVSRCAGGRCFAVFAALKAGGDVQDHPGV
jgi:hypothetical protein